MLINFTNPFIDWVFPRRCLACGNDVAEEDICSDCFDLCHHNLNQTLFNDKNYAYLFYYELTIKELIKKVKFHRELLACHLLLKLIKDELAQSPLMYEIFQYSPQAVTFVPTHPFNRLQRAIDLPFLIARTIASDIGVPVVSLLRRTRFNDNQVRKNRSDRLMEIRGAFALAAQDKSFERLLLVDDVVTTGATLGEAGTILTEISQEIRCVAVAKTP